MSNKYTFFYLKYLAVFVVIFLLVKEWLFWLDSPAGGFGEARPSFPKRYNFIAFVFLFDLANSLGCFYFAFGIFKFRFFNGGFVYIMFDSCADYLRACLQKQIIKNFIILTSIYCCFFIYELKI